MTEAERMILRWWVSSRLLYNNKHWKPFRNARIVILRIKHGWSCARIGKRYRIHPTVVDRVMRSYQDFKYFAFHPQYGYRMLKCRITA